MFPLTFSHPIHRRRATRLAIAVGAAVAALVPAAAATAQVTSTADCTDPAISQPFLSYKDTSWYFLAPGGDFSTPAAVADAGWQLSGGASIVSTTKPDGTTGYVLDLPSKATAVTPVMCVTKDDPLARMFVRDVVGGEGVQFFVSYAGTPTWTKPKSTGQVHGGAMQWQAIAPVNLQPYSVSGWQLVTFTFVAGGTTSRFQISDVWVDPKMR